MTLCLLAVPFTTLLDNEAESLLIGNFFELCETKIWPLCS